MIAQGIECMICMNCMFCMDLVTIWQEAKMHAEAQEQGEDVKIKANEAKIVKLIFQIPPIDKMDASLSTLGNCE